MSEAEAASSFTKNRIDVSPTSINNREKKLERSMRKSMKSVRRNSQIQIPMKSLLTQQRSKQQQALET